MKYVLTQPRRGHIQQSQRWPSYDFEFLAFAQSRVESTENFHNIVNLQRNKFNDQLVHFLSSTNILSRTSFSGESGLACSVESLAKAGNQESKFIFVPAKLKHIKVCLFMGLTI